MDLSTRNGDLMVNNGESWDDMGFTLWAIKNGWIFHSYVNVCQRVYTIFSDNPYHAMV